QDRVFEVVAVPRHERDQHVLAEREFAEVGRRTVRQRVALRHHVTDVHQRTLVQVGVLVGTRVLGERVDVHARIVLADFLLIDAHHDARGVDLLDHAAAARGYGDAGVARYRAFYA